eukprot:TRINITY_DN91696_c0_g1_i1.p1 TRINITY_DN91696_c0_g1~~TRINITY_DN91696_c0_g1_i1.p1  ORF type:complete len:350 (+),score=64.71 TRINITY_DN91696_c0_g1_i1:95-1051(+)
MSMHVTAGVQSKFAAAQAVLSGRMEIGFVHGGAGTGVQMTPKSAGADVKALCKRTRMCKFNLIGACKRGKTCVFAHSEADLQEEPNLEKTKMCTSFSLSGTCKWGTSCRFAHGPRELRQQVPQTGFEESDGQNTGSSHLQDLRDRLLVAKAHRLLQETLLSMRLRLEQRAMEVPLNLPPSPYSPPKCEAASIACQPLLQAPVRETSQSTFLLGRQSTMQQVPSTDTLPELSYKAFSRQSTMQPPSTDVLPELSRKAILPLGAMGSPQDEDSDSDTESEQSLTADEPVIISIKNTFIHAAVQSPSPRRSKSQPACSGHS